jgi:hypothetical protein
LNVKKSQGGKYYAELDTWKPNKEANQDAPQASTANAEPEGDLPF